MKWKSKAVTLLTLGVAACNQSPPREPWETQEPGAPSPSSSAYIPWLIWHWHEQYARMRGVPPQASVPPLIRPAPRPIIRNGFGSRSPSMSVGG